MDQSVYAALEADEQPEIGDVPHVALDLGADGVGLGERLPRIDDALLEAEADAALVGVDVEHHHLDLLAGRDDLAGVDVLLRPAHFGDVDEALDARLEFDEGAVVGDVGDAAAEPGARGVFQLHAVPRVGLELLHAERDALGLDVEADDLDLDGLADGEDLARVVDPAPGHVGDVEESVDLAQVHEGAVIGDVLDDALEHLALAQAGDELGARLGAGLLHHHPARDDDVAAPPVHLEDLEGLPGVEQGGDVAHGADVDLAAGQEGDGAAEIDGEAALDAAEDGPLDPLLGAERLLEHHPGLLAAGALAAEHRLAAAVLDALEEDLDGVADREARRLAGGGELLDRHPALGLQAHVYDRHVVVDGDHPPLDDRALQFVRPLRRLLEQSREVFIGRGLRPSGRGDFAHAFVRSLAPGPPARLRIFQCGRQRGLGVEVRRIQQERVRGGLQRRRRARAVALVPLRQIPQNRRHHTPCAARAQLRAAAFGARLRRGGEEYLHRRFGKDDRTDVAPVEHGAGAPRRVLREAALPSEQRAADGGLRGDPGGGGAHRLIAQAGRVEGGRVPLPR